MAAATAWYILPSNRPWTRWFNVLHWPYTLWHLSYIALGAALAEELSFPLLGWAMLAFFLGMGVAAHCFDLLKGDPLRLSLPRKMLWMVAIIALSLAVAIGTWQWASQNVPNIVIIFVGLGVAVTTGYNLEWSGFHGDWQFAIGWAVFPLLVGYFAQGIQFHPVILFALGFAFTSAMAQRILSKRARLYRRVEGDVTQDWELKPLDQALIWLNAAIVLLALGLLVGRLVPGGGY